MISAGALLSSKEASSSAGYSTDGILRFAGFSLITS